MRSCGTSSKWSLRRFQGKSPPAKPIRHHRRHNNRLLCGVWRASHPLLPLRKKLHRGRPASHCPSHQSSIRSSRLPTSRGLPPGVFRQLHYSSEGRARRGDGGLYCLQPIKMIECYYADLTAIEISEPPCPPTSTAVGTSISKSNGGRAPLMVEGATTQSGRPRARTGLCKATGAAGVERQHPSGLVALAGEGSFPRNRRTAS